MAGGIVGIGEGVYTEIKNCHVSNAKISAACVGGIAGEMYNMSNKVRNCTVSAVLESSGCVGGVVGRRCNLIENCFVNAEIVFTGTDTSKIGMFYGADNYSIEITVNNCAFIGGSNIKTSTFTGELDAATVLDLKNCYGLINQKGYFSDGDFAGFGIVAGMNDGLPLQRALFFMAEFAPDIEVGWFDRNGFEKI